MSRLDQLLSMFNEDPKDNFLQFAIAKEYEKSGDFDLAIEQYEMLKKRDAAYIGVYYHLAYLYAEKGENELAFKIYDEGINMAKKQSDFHSLSELLNAKKNLEMEAL